MVLEQQQRPVHLAIMVAVSRNGVIGRKGDMPWRLSTDLQRFKALTMGKPLVLGRKTFESFGARPLPGRPHVIVSRNADYRVGYDGVEVAPGLDPAILRARQLAHDSGVDEVCIIGGGEIYRQALALCDRLYITHVEADIVDGDTFFPAIDGDVFASVHEEHVPQGPKDNYATRYVEYRRRT